MSCFVLMVWTIGISENNMLELQPSEIRYSQDSISNTFTSYENMLIGITLDKLLTGETTIDNIPKIEVIQRNGTYFTADNRRLWVFKKAEELGFLETIKVFLTNKFNPNKFTTKNGGISIRMRRGDPGGDIWKKWTKETISDNKTNNLSVRSLRVQGPSVMQKSRCLSKTSWNYIHVFDANDSSDTVGDDKAERSCILSNAPYNSAATHRRKFSYTAYPSQVMSRQNFSYNNEYNSAETCRQEVSYNTVYNSAETHGLFDYKKLIFKENKQLPVPQSSVNLYRSSSQTSAFLMDSSRQTRKEQTGKIFDTAMSQKVGSVIGAKKSTNGSSLEVEKLKSALFDDLDSGPIEKTMLRTHFKDNDSFDSLYVHVGGDFCNNNNKRKTQLNSNEKCISWLYNLCQ